MEVKEWLKRHLEKERKALALQVGTSVNYLYQLAGGHRQASPELAKKIEEATEGAITKQELRPDIWD